MLKGHARRAPTSCQGQPGLERGEGTPRYGVTVQELVEALLLECARERPAKATPPPRARGASRVIDLEQARKQKAQRP